MVKAILKPANQNDWLQTCLPGYERYSSDILKLKIFFICCDILQKAGEILDAEISSIKSDLCGT